MKPLKIQWVTVNGERRLSVRLPCGVRFTINPVTAWALTTELRYQLLKDNK